MGCREFPLISAPFSSAGKALRSQSHGVIQPHASTDDGRFADDDTGAVIDEEALLHLPSGMNINPGQGCAISAMIRATADAPNSCSAWAKR